MSSRVVVITGASSGVGRATALELARSGARLGLVARGEEALEATRREVQQLGGTALSISTDVADYQQVEAAAARTEAELGSIDVWINDAMTSVFSRVRDLRPEEVKRVTEVNYLGTVNGTLVALSRMLPRDRGKIVQVSSALAYRGIPLQAAYCGSKHAIKGFTESLITELLEAGSRVSVTMVALPAVNTPQFEVVKTRLPRHPMPVPPIFQPEVPARAIVRAIDSNRREMRVAASTLATIFGNQLVPGLLDRYLARTGINSQQTDEPVDPGRPDNLLAPIPGDRGAHGRFDDQSHARSLQQLAARNVRRIAGGIAVLSAATVALRRRP